MSRVQAFDEIIEQLGPPAFARWVSAPYGATAVVALFRHCGATVDLSASRVFRVILQLSSSDVETYVGDQVNTRRIGRGSIITSFTWSPQRIRIRGTADTLHILLSSNFSDAVQTDESFRLSTRLEPALRASAAQALVGLVQTGSASQLEEAVTSVARAVAREQMCRNRASGGLTPQAMRAIHLLLDDRVCIGVSVAELAEAAGLSLHHFIKVCSASEGFTPHALLLHKRMAKAIALLTKQTARVDEVAITVGFSSPSHFVSTFHRLVGVTPAAFRDAAAA